MCSFVHIFFWDKRDCCWEVLLVFGWKVERSKRISENVKWEEMDHLWKGFGFWSSLWAIISLHHWNAAVY